MRRRESALPSFAAIPAPAHCRYSPDLLSTAIGKRWATTRGESSARQSTDAFMRISDNSSRRRDSKGSQADLPRANARRNLPSSESAYGTEALGGKAACSTATSLFDDVAPYSSVPLIFPSVHGVVSLRRAACVMR